MTTGLLLGFALVSVAVWIGLLLLRGGFWRCDQRIAPAAEFAAWPAVVAVIPARNEAATIGFTVGSLLAQNYPGKIHVIVVDDNSDDDTATAAGRSDRLTVVKGEPLEPGWTGKLWALQQGLTAAGDTLSEAGYALLTDADIEHHPANLRELVSMAEKGGLDLTSLMVKLRCESGWERLLIPAFVFFFQKLYPFPWVNDRSRPEAAAAGGCMLVRLSALVAAGGIQTIRDRLIDDCALATLIKRHGPIWLGLTEHTVSLRAYDDLAQIWHMVARTAFVQLNHSVLALFGTVLGMVIIYLVPSVSLFVGVILRDTALSFAGAAAMGIMTAAYAPTLRLYGQPLWRGPWLPVAAVLYLLITVSSAIRHWRGRGSAWKGRTYSEKVSRPA